jgi:CMP-N-acetylneuraminic acid synthetase
VAYQGYTVLAVVPARGGSKGIPGKNLKTVNGLSLVGHAGRVVSQLPWIDRALLSTDDGAIAEEGKRWGLDVPFFRPEELAGDTAGSVGMWQHAWLAAEAEYGMRFDLSVLLEPTSPLRIAADIEQTVATLIETREKCSGAATVSRTPAHYTPHKTLEIDSEGRVRYYLENGEGFSQRQGIPPYYHRNGICYAVWRETLVDRGRILEAGHCAAVLIERHVVNIDDPVDIQLAELLLSEYSRSS